MLRRPWTGLEAIVLALLVGCGQRGGDLPPLHSARGTLTYQGNPVAAATIVFQGETDQTLTLKGFTNDRGQFELATIHGSQKHVGVPEGLYTVTIVFPFDENQRGGGSVTLQEKYQVHGGENNFPINLSELTFR